jgi:amino acid transporter
MIYQSTVAILLLVGFESVTALGAEARNPDKDIKRGVLISLLIQGGVCYLFEYFAANFAIGGALISNTDSTSNQLIGGYAAAANSKGTSAPIGDMIHTIGENNFGLPAPRWLSSSPSPCSSPSSAPRWPASTPACGSRTR